MTRSRKIARHSRAVVRHRRRVKGGNILRDIISFGKKANRFLKRTKLISNIGKALDKGGVPYAGKIGKVAGVLGYGKRKRVVIRRRRRKGRGVNPAGGALRLAGSRGRGKKTLSIAY